jgi:hypothetical protein
MYIEYIKNYYNSLTEEEKFKAFKNMVLELEMGESVSFSEEREQIYWTSCGDSLGREE